MKYREMVERLLIEHSALIDNLVATDNLEEWAIFTKSLSKDDKAKIYEIAEPKWIERKISNGTLLLHPDVRRELIARNFKPLSVHRKMIWASTLVMLDGENSRESYNRIKEKIIKKYDNKWWFDVYNRVKPTYAAKSRLEKEELGKATSFATQNSVFLGGVIQDFRDDILKMIPSK